MADIETLFINVWRNDVGVHYLQWFLCGFASQALKKVLQVAIATPFPWN
jgi:hypothetical protein